jgi:hypothetical protein
MNIKSCKGGIYGGRNLWEEFMGGMRKIENYKIHTYISYLYGST